MIMNNKWLNIKNSRLLMKIIAGIEIAAITVFLGACGNAQNNASDATNDAVNNTGNVTGEADGNGVVNENDTVNGAENTDQVVDNGEISEGDSSEGYVPGPVTFTDALGREVTVDSPERVITLLGSFCDTWYLAGGEVIGTVRDSWTAFDLDLDEAVVNLGSFLSPDIEAIVSELPDFVIASANTEAQTELVDTLESAGITVAYFDVSNFDSYLEMLDICTDITGRKDLYEKNGLNIVDEIEAAKDKIDGSKPTVLFIRAAASSVKAKGSEGTVGGEILADLDCINIADSDDALLDDLSLEAIVLADPEYIFVTTQGEDTEAAIENFENLIASSSAWASLSAVQNGNYYIIDKALYNSKPNARWGEAYALLADILYQ